MKAAIARALLLAAALTLGLGLLHALGLVRPLLLFAIAGAAVAAALLPWRDGRLIDPLIDAVRRCFWAAEEGRFHSFGGIALAIEDDGRHVWINGAGLQRVLGRSEPDDVLAARISGAWRYSPEGVLMLRVDAVVGYLGHMPGRDDPRVQRLRRYLERDVLYPASRRRHPA
jgi:hypothetical protein